VTVGFIGLGRMGQPMALNLLRAGIPLLVWSRNVAQCGPARDAGAVHAPTLDALFAQATRILLMVRGEDAIDEVLGRHTQAFRARVAGRCIVHLGTTSPEWSGALERDVDACDGRYVEAPVSGSRVPAEQGSLVGMIAGAASAVDAVLPLLAPLCRQTFRCGPVPNALRLKLAVNHYLIAMVAALAETVHAATAAGVDVHLLRDVLDCGAMASDVSRGKLDKLVRGDFAAQAAIGDVAHIACLVMDQAARAGAHVPLMERAAHVFRSAEAAGHGCLDMAAVRHAFDAGADAANRPHRATRPHPIPVPTSNGASA
jgi:3-hydroxyisobutyrate dehydrogenase